MGCLLKAIEELERKLEAAQQHTTDPQEPYLQGTPDHGDIINKPAHYNAGNIEVIDFLRSQLIEAEYIGFCKANAIKYLSRAGYKGSKLQDYQKAKYYIEKLIENEDKK